MILDIPMTIRKGTKGEQKEGGGDGEMISSYLRGEREVHKLWNTKRLMGLRFDEDYDNVLENHYLY